MDQETRILESDHHSIRLWLRLFTCSSLIERYLRRELREEFNFTLSRFDLLAQLERAPGGLTMGELTERIMVSGGNVTNLAKQLEKERLIKRTPTTIDRRTFMVTLTKKGRIDFRKMARRHEEWIIKLLGDMDEDEVATLSKLLAKMKQTVLSAY